MKVWIVLIEWLGKHVDPLRVGAGMKGVKLVWFDYENVTLGK